MQLLPLIQKHPLLGAATGIGSSALTFLEDLNILFRLATGLGGVIVVILTIAIKYREFRKLRKSAG